MSEDKTLEEMKDHMIKEFPDHKDEINLATNLTELGSVYKEITEDETEPDETTNEGEYAQRILHEHKIVKEKPEEDEVEGSPSIHVEGSSLGATGGKVRLESPIKPQKTWKNPKEMVDELFKLELAGKIERTKPKPNIRIVHEGQKASAMIDKLYESASKSGRVERAIRDIFSGRVQLREEPKEIRDLLFQPKRYKGKLGKGARVKE